MTGIVLVERIVELLIASGSVALFMLFYGEYKWDRKIAAGIYWIVGFTYAFLFWFVKLYYEKTWLLSVFVVVGFLVYYLLYVILSKGKWYINLVIIVFYYVIDGLGNIAKSLLFELFFDKTYMEPMLYDTWEELLACEVWSFGMTVVLVVLKAFVMNRFFAFHRMHHDTLGSSVYWIVQLTVGMTVQSIYTIRNPVVDSKYMCGVVGMMIFFFSMISIVYSLLKKMLLNRQTSYMNCIMDIQKEFYQDVYSSYEDMSNFRHDLVNHIRQINFLQEKSTRIANKYSNEVDEKIEELNWYGNTSFIKLILDKTGQKEEYKDKKVLFIELESESAIYEKLSRNDVISIVKCMAEIGLLNAHIREGKEITYQVVQKMTGCKFVLMYPATKKKCKLTKEQKCTINDAKKVLRYVANKEGMSINIFKEKEVYRMEVRTDEKRKKEK